jgi:hypothetical protein
LAIGSTLAISRRLCSDSANCSICRLPLAAIGACTGDLLFLCCFVLLQLRGNEARHLRNIQV